MHPALVAAVLAIASLLISPKRTCADILIDFENTPSGVFSSYTEQGVTFTTVAPGMFLTSELFGDAPNGTRGLIGVPDLSEQAELQTAFSSSSQFMPEFPELPQLPLPPGVLPNPNMPTSETPVPKGFFPAMRADFDFVADFVCVDLGDDWVDDDAIFLLAFNENDELIAFVSNFPGADPGDMRQLSIWNPGIHYVTFGAMAPSDEASSVFADNFRARQQGITAVPEWEGATAMLMLLGLVGGACSYFVKRRSHVLAVLNPYSS